MKLWLVCFLMLFLGAETAQWLGKLPWVSSVELSLPLTVVGGIGLAIASNYSTLFGRHWSTFGPTPAKPETPPLPNTVPQPSPTVAVAVKPSKSSRNGDTISFEIKKSRGKDEGVRG
jgi:hypothetical protein